MPPGSDTRPEAPAQRLCHRHHVAFGVGGCEVCSQPREGHPLIGGVFGNLIELGPFETLCRRVAGPVQGYARAHLLCVFARNQPLPWHIDAVGVACVANAVVGGRKDGLHQQVNRLGRAVFEWAVAIENIEGFQYLEACRVRGRNAYVKAAICRGNRLSPRSLIRRQVFPADESACRSETLTDPVAQFSSVERLLPAGDHLGHRFSERGLAQHRTDGRLLTGTVERVGRPADVGESHKQRLDGVRIHRRNRVAVGGVVDCLPEQLIERQSPVCAVHREPSRQVPGHQRRSWSPVARNLVEQLGLG